MEHIYMYIMYLGDECMYKQVNLIHAYVWCHETFNLGNTYMTNTYT